MSPTRLITAPDSARIALCKQKGKKANSITDKGSLISSALSQQPLSSLLWQYSHPICRLECDWSTEMRKIWQKLSFAKVQSHAPRRSLMCRLSINRNSCHVVLKFKTKENFLDRLLYSKWQADHSVIIWLCCIEIIKRKEKYCWRRATMNEAVKWVDLKGKNFDGRCCYFWVWKQSVKASQG